MEQSAIPPSRYMAFAHVSYESVVETATYHRLISMINSQPSSETCAGISAAFPKGHAALISGSTRITNSINWFTPLHLLMLTTCEIVRSRVVCVCVCCMAAVCRRARQV